VRRNRVINNNTPNFADPGAIVSNVLKGTGIMLLAADNTEVYENEIVGNGTFGIMTIGLRLLFPAPTPLDVDPNPDGNRIYNNILRDNGKDPDERLKRFGIPPVDLLWDMTGKGNQWNQPDATRFPTDMPSALVETKSVPPIREPLPALWFCRNLIGSGEYPAPDDAFAGAAESGDTHARARAVWAHPTARTCR
jgi:hypothetical protein